VARKKKYSAKQIVKELARERIGAVPPARVIVPKAERKPKHKKPPGDSE
jgi:hypothetical protein